MKKRFIIVLITLTLIVGILGFAVPTLAKTLGNPPSGADLRIYRIIDAISGDVYRFDYTTGNYESDIGGSEVDPVFTASPSYEISSGDITNWNGKLSAVTGTALDNVFSTNGLLKRTGTGTYTLDTNTYLTSNQSITLSGDLSGSGTTAISGTVTGIKGATLPALSTGYLYYNGSAWSFQTPSSSGLDPVATVTLWDDFASGLLTTGNIGDLGWGLTGTAPTVIASVANHNGIRQIPTTTTSANISAIWLGGAANTDTVLYNDYCDMTFIVGMTDVTSDTAFVGAMDAMGTAVGNQDRYGFEYIDSSDTYWMMVTGDGSSSTRTATNITVVINTWYKLRIVRDGSGVNYYIDGVSKGSVATTLPNTALNIGFHIQTNTTVAKYLQADLFNMTLGVTR